MWWWDPWIRKSAGWGYFPQCPVYVFFVVVFLIKHNTEEHWDLTWEGKAETEGIFYCSAHLKSCLNEYNYGNTNLSNVMLRHSHHPHPFCTHPSLLHVQDWKIHFCGTLSNTVAMIAFRRMRHFQFNVPYPVPLLRWYNIGTLMNVFAGSEKRSHRLVLACFCRIQSELWFNPFIS